MTAGGRHGVTVPLSGHTLAEMGPVVRDARAGRETQRLSVRAVVRALAP